MKKYWAIENGENNLVASLKDDNFFITNKETGEIFEIPKDSLGKFINELNLIYKDINGTFVKTEYSERLKKIQEKWPRAYTKWSLSDDENLKKIYINEKNILEISKLVERAEGGVISRLRYLELINETQYEDLRKEYKVGSGFKKSLTSDKAD
tara:strand:- start:131 stop:589 length:459 start_codon:yes stop_codon:yes gene_type:complete